MKNMLQQRCEGQMEGNKEFSAYKLFIFSVYPINAINI